MYKSLIEVPVQAEENNREITCSHTCQKWGSNVAFSFLRLKNYHLRTCRVLKLVPVQFIAVSWPF